MSDTTRRNFVLGVVASAAGVSATSTATARDVNERLLPSLPQSPVPVPGPLGPFIPIDPLNPIPGAVGPTSYAKALADALLQEAEKRIRHSLASYSSPTFDSLPSALRGVADYMKLVRACMIVTSAHEYQGIQLRLNVVDKALNELMALLSPSNGSGHFFLSQAIRELVPFLRAVLNGDDVRPLITKIATILLDPSKLMDDVVASTLNDTHSFWRPLIDLPHSLQPGVHFDWIYGNGPHSNYNFDIQFRLRLAGSIDSVFRRYATGSYTASAIMPSFSNLVCADNRTSVTLLINVIQVVLESSIHYIIRPALYPQVEADWLVASDVSATFAASTGIQVRSAIRGAIGTGLRGLWQWTAGNENVIEAIGVLLGTIASASVDAALRRFLWQFRILCSRTPAGEGDGFFLAQSVPTRSLPATVPLNGSVIEGTEIVRYYALPQNGLELSDLFHERFREHIQPLRKAFKDYVAYTETCHERTRCEQSFPQTISSESVVARYSPLATFYILSAHTQWNTEREPSWYSPVVRLYCQAGVFVIPKLGAPPVPGDSQVGEYYQAMLPQSMALKGAFIRSSGGSESAIETEQNALGARTKPGVRLILERVTCLLARGSDTHDRLVLKAFEDGGLRELGAKAQFHLDPGESQDVKLLLVGEKSVTIQLCELDRMNRPEVFGEVNITASGPGFEVFSGTSDGSNFKYVIEWR